MRHSHLSQGFTIIPSTLEAREINETQVTMSGVVTQFVTLYLSCQLNSNYTNLLLQKVGLTSFSRREQVQSFKVEVNLNIFGYSPWCYRKSVNQNQYLSSISFTIHLRFGSSLASTLVLTCLSDGVVTPCSWEAPLFCFILRTSTVDKGFPHSVLKLLTVLSQEYVNFLALCYKIVHKDLDYLDISQNSMLIHYINDIMLMRTRKQ